MAYLAGLIALAAAAPLALPHAEGSLPLALAALLGVGLLTAGATAAAVRLADRSERSGTPANALLVWGATAGVVAAAERALLGVPTFGAAPQALLVGLVLAHSHPPRRGGLVTWVRAGLVAVAMPRLRCFWSTARS